MRTIERRNELRARAAGPTWPAAIAVGLTGAAVGAAVAFLTDPQRGRARRARLADQAAAAVRRASRELARAGRMVQSTAEGKLEALAEGGGRVGPTDDVTLRDRAESELFRDPAIPKGGINVNVERGVLVLRGEVPDAAMRERLGEQASRIEGVWNVRNLLHLPGEPAEEVAASV